MGQSIPTGKRRIILLLLACGVLVAGAILLRTTSKEPSYNGRTLGFWVVVYANDFQNRANRGRDPFLGTGTASEHAIRQIGTNAIPWLIEWIRYEQPRRKAALLRWLNRCLPLAGFQGPVKDNQDLRATGAMRAFVALGSQGKSALPELSRLLDSPGKVPGASKAGPALAGLGAEALPAFLSALANPDPGNRANAAFNLQYLRTNALPATPQLLTARSPIRIRWSHGRRRKRWECSKPSRSSLFPDFKPC